MKLILVVFTLCVFMVAEDKYFPDNTLCENDNPKLCDFSEHWYSQHLSAMHEPSLWQESKETSNQTYRFLWLRSFHRPISSRLDIAADGSGMLTLKVLGGAGGYKPGKIVTERTLPISKALVDQFLALLQKIDFWNIPTEPKTDEVGADGAQWILEGTKDGHYHVTDRWSPKNEYREPGLFLVTRLGVLKVPKSELY